MIAPDPATAALEHVYREASGRILATLIRILGDFDLAEEMASEAFATALQRWRVDGVPDNPRAWLIRTARNRAIDRIRRNENLRRKTRLIAAAEPTSRELDDAEHDFPDDRLALIFTCCHPALNMEARVALTLRTLGGLSTAEIARAFLVPGPTMAQRLVRAKKKIQAAGIPYRVPPASLLTERLTGVLATLYLIFNEGYAASEGDELVRRALCEEAIWLGRVLVQLMPDPEALGLLALMLLHDARRPARVQDGELVVLEEQDRSLWDHEQIAEGIALLDLAMERRTPGPYQIQAAIASLHGQAEAAPDTDWHQISLLYGALQRYTDSPVVALNHAAAVAMAEGPERGLELLDQIAGTAALDSYYLLPAARADLLRRLGRRDEAAVAYAHALSLVKTEPERRYLTRRLAEL